MTKFIYYFFILYKIIDILTRQPPIIVIRCCLFDNTDIHNVFDIANTYKPYIFMDIHENYFPSDLNYIVNNSKISQYDNGIFNDIKYYYDIDKSIWTGYKDNIQDAPYYYISYKCNNFIIIQYLFIYPYNGNYNTILGKLGGHTGDIEHISMYVDEKNKKIKYIYLSSHSNADGQWVDINKIEFINNRPVLYSARNGHGLYSYEGTIYRYFSLINDLTSKGKLWDPKEIIDITNKKYENIMLGTIAKMPNHNSWYKNDCHSSTNFLHRFFRV